MLGKKSGNDKIVYCDAHFHLSDCIDCNCFCNCFDFSDDIIGCSCFHSPLEWNSVFEKDAHSNKNVVTAENANRFLLSFGLHPQNPDLSFLVFLENLLAENKIHAIGECGFDFYKPFMMGVRSVCSVCSVRSIHSIEDFKKIQEEAFLSQIALAQKYKKPVVIHARKASEKLFEYSKELKKLPAVLFHSFMGTPTEAKSLLNRGINGFFSFGKQIFNGNKNAMNCVRELPLENLLLETDAPFQTLKGEEKTFPSEIKRVYFGAFKLRYNHTDFLLQNISENAIGKINPNLKNRFDCFGKNFATATSENENPKDTNTDIIEEFRDFAFALRKNFIECFCTP